MAVTGQDRPAGCGNNLDYSPTWIGTRRAGSMATTSPRQLGRCQLRSKCMTSSQQRSSDQCSSHRRSRHLCREAMDRDSRRPNPRIGATRCVKHGGGCFLRSSQNRGTPTTCRRAASSPLPKSLHPKPCAALCRVRVGVVRPFVGSSHPLQCWWKERERSGFPESERGLGLCLGLAA